MSNDLEDARATVSEMVDKASEFPFVARIALPMAILAAERAASLGTAEDVRRLCELLADALGKAVESNDQIQIDYHSGKMLVSISDLADAGDETAAIDLNKLADASPHRLFDIGLAFAAMRAGG